MRADVSNCPDRLQQLVCRAVQQCYDLLKQIYYRTGAFNSYVLEEALPDNAFEIALECGWLPKDARADSLEWKAWVRELLAGRFSRVGLRDPHESDPYLFVPFPVAANSGDRAAGTLPNGGSTNRGTAEGKMADIPLPGLDPKDPRSILSEAARRRISDAHADADLVRVRALASIEARYRSKPDSDKSLVEYQTTGQTGVQSAEANVQAARTVLCVVRDEFRAAGKSGRELRQIMEDELEAAVYSLELTTIQRDLLWQELGLDRYAEQEPTSATKGIAKGPTAQLPELPSRFQNAFEAAKAKAELAYATRGDNFLHHPQLADSSLHGLLLIQKVFFEFCKQARDACREGQLSLAQASKAVDAAWPIICDYYFERERGQGSEERRSKFRVALWRTVTDDKQWKQHLSDLVALSEAAAPVSPGAHAAAAQPGEQPIQGIADGATRMRRPARPEIEKFANDVFAVARDRILKEHADQRRRALAQAELTGNSGAYLPALIKCEAQHVRETILALADAYVEAFTIHGVPSDTRVDLRAVARQVTAGAISGIRGHLRLRSGRLRIAEEGRGVPWHLEIERAMDAAVKEGRLKLRRQRIEFKDSDGPLARGEGFTPQSVGAPPQDPRFWRALRKEFDDLAIRQQSVLGHPPHDKWLRAYCDFSSDHGEFGRCGRQGGLDGRLISEFADVATRGAFALGCRPDAEPVGFWLYCLGQDLLKSAEPEVRREFSGGEWSGYIQGLLESCAGYCLRLAAAAECQADPLAGWVPLVRADWRDDAELAKECPEFLLPAKSVRLAAIGKLRKDAAEVLQRIKPQQEHEVEHCLWPLFSEYAECVLDKMAEAELGSISSAADDYGAWLKSACLPAIIRDVCGPIFGQFPITLRYVVEQIGEVYRPDDLVKMRQVVWHMIADAILPERGSPLFRLETRLTNALLEERVPHWEAKAAHLQPATKSTTKPKGVEPGSAESEPSLAIKEGIVDEQLGDQPNGDPAVPPTSDAVGRPGDAGAAQQTPPEVSPLATQADSMTDNYTIPDVKSERRALRDAYKGECRKHGVQVTDAMIAEVASGNWHGRTAIQKWLGCDPRYDGEPDRLIRNVFARKPHIPRKS